MAMSFEYNKGDIVWICIDDKEKKGSEQMGNRPAVIVQNNISNRVSNTILVAPITDASNIRKLGPNHVFIKKGEGGIHIDSVILCNQIITCDKTKRVVARIGSLSKIIIKQINNALKATFDLDDEF